MIINLVIPDVEICLDAYKKIEQEDRMVQLFVGHAYKCRHHSAVAGIVISNNRIGNGRLLNKENLEAYFKIEDISSKLKKILLEYCEVKNESIHSNVAK